MADRGLQKDRLGLETGLTVGFWVLQSTCAKYILCSTPVSEKHERQRGKTEREKAKKKTMTEILATMSLPVDRLLATDCNAAACVKKTVAKKPPVSKGNCFSDI